MCIVCACCLKSHDVGSSGVKQKERERAREFIQVVLVIVPCTLVWDSPPLDSYSYKGVVVIPLQATGYQP